MGLQTRNESLEQLVQMAKWQIDDPGVARAALLAAILDSSDDAIISETLDGTVTGWNRAAEAMYGYEADEVVGKSLSSLISEDRPEHQRAILEQIRAGQRVEPHETNRVRKDGSSLAVFLTVSPIQAPDGSVIGTSSTTRDITPIVRLLSEFAETKKLLDSLLESSIKYSVIGENLDHQIVSWNAGAQRNYGYTQEEVAGKSSDILHSSGDIRSGAVHELRETAGDEGLAEGEFERVRKDGSRFIASVAITRRNDASNQHIGYLVMSSDISAQKIAEQKLRSAAQYARSLIEASLDPLVTIAPNGRITDANEATIRATGLAREALTDTDFCDCFTDSKRAREAYEQAFALGAVINFPLTLRHQNGSLVDVLYNASVYKDEQGNVLGVLAAARDVTAEKRVQTQLAEQRARELGRLADLERFQTLTVGRELKMIELKRQIEALEQRLGSQ